MIEVELYWSEFNIERKRNGSDRALLVLIQRVLQKVRDTYYLCRPMLMGSSWSDGSPGSGERTGVLSRRSSELSITV